MFDQLTDLVAQASGWAYAAVLVLALVDAVLPVVPSETAVITAGLVAASGRLSLALVVLSAAVGAVLGDNLAYAIGHRYGGAISDRFFAGEKSRGRLEHAKRHLAQRGGELIMVARFVPGGRAAVTLTAGLTRYSWRRFVAYDLAAGLLWAGYGGLLGYFGGRAFEQQAWKGLLLALATALALTAVTEGVRRLRRRDGAARLTCQDGRLRLSGERPDRSRRKVLEH
jgi:membrane protein DedA with SNARE-associated domain